MMDNKQSSELSSGSIDRSQVVPRKVEHGQQTVNDMREGSGVEVYALEGPCKRTQEIHSPRKRKSSPGNSRTLTKLGIEKPFTGLTLTRCGR
jgi:hypothetical protein